MTDRIAIDGHVSPTSKLSPRTAFESMSSLVRPLVCYEPLDPWELDTASLPPALARHRRRMRAFADRHLAPVALRVDAGAHGVVSEWAEVRGSRTEDASIERPEMAVLRAAGREGLLSDMLPAPFGSGDPRLFTSPLYLAAALKTEELAAVDGGLMLLVCAHSLGVAPVLLSGDLSAIRRFIIPAFRESLAGDPHVFAFAITEPAAGSDVEDGRGASLHRPGVVAKAAPGGYRLHGRKCFISGGDIAKSIVVFAALEAEGMESWTAFLVPGGAPGLRVPRTELKMGMRASGAAELELDGVFVPADHVIGELRQGWGLNRATLNMSRLPVAAMGVGLARSALDAAVLFACRTRIGKKPLIAYQEVQLELAEMMADTQAARAMVWAAAGRTQAVQREASAAKVFATDVALRVCTRAMDLLGNHAMLHDERVEKAYRDARLTQIFEGTNQINRLSMIEDEQDRLLDMIGSINGVGVEVKSHTSDEFFRVSRTVKQTSEGPVELPILYYDVTNVVALFDADAGRVRSILEGTGLEPAVMFGQRAVVALSFYEYRHTSVGVYNEVGTAVLAMRGEDRAPRMGLFDLYRAPSRRRVGAYVVDLPVTTAAANAAGREIWGYPKFITSIPFSLEGRQFRSAVLDPSDSSMICELAGQLGRGLPAPPMSLMTYTILEGALVRTHVDVRGTVTARRPGTAVLRVGPSSHRMAENLRRLGVSGARPRLVLTTDRFQSKLHDGERIARIREERAESAA